MRSLLGSLASAARIGAQKRPMSATFCAYSMGKAAADVERVEHAQLLALGRGDELAAGLDGLRRVCRRHCACEPTWNDSPRTGIASLRARRASSSRSSGSQPNLRDRSHTAPGRAERHAQQQLAPGRGRPRTCAPRPGLSATKIFTPRCSALRMSMIALDGMRVDAARRVDAELRDQLGLAGGGQV